MHAAIKYKNTKSMKGRREKKKLQLVRSTQGISVDVIRCHGPPSSSRLLIQLNLAIVFVPPVGPSLSVDIGQE